MKVMLVFYNNSQLHYICALKMYKSYFVRDRNFTNLNSTNQKCSYSLPIIDALVIFPIMSFLDTLGCH